MAVKFEMVFMGIPFSVRKVENLLHDGGQRHFKGELLDCLALDLCHLDERVNIVLRHNRARELYIFRERHALGAQLRERSVAPATMPGIVIALG